MPLASASQPASKIHEQTILEVEDFHESVSFCHPETWIFLLKCEDAELILIPIYPGSLIIEKKTQRIRENFLAQLVIQTIFLDLRLFDADVRKSSKHFFPCQMVLKFMVMNPTGSNPDKHSPGKNESKEIKHTKN